MNTTLTIRTNKKIKDTASKILQKKGMTLSGVLNMYLRKIVEDKDFSAYDSAFDELTKEDVKAIKKAKAEFARGEFYTLGQIKKEFNLD
jgi:antitoxin component of RelBE/YafQ-DinJ toxin-antitoxin module